MLAIVTMVKVVLALGAVLALVGVLIAVQAGARAAGWDGCVWILEVGGCL